MMAMADCRGLAWRCRGYTERYEIEASLISLACISYEKTQWWCLLVYCWLVVQPIQFLMYRDGGLG